MEGNNQNTENLKQKTIFSLIWNAFDKIGFQAIAFIIGLITMRLLSPDDFGLLGALSIFTALSNILIENGFTSAMVRRQQNTNAEYTAILCFNIFISLIFYLILFGSANYIAEYYGMPELKDLSRFLFLGILFNSLGIVQNIILTKELAFKKLSLANMIGAITSGIITIILILQGYTYWALAWQIILQASIKCLFLWIFSQWRPTAKPDFSIIKELFTFTFSLILSALINTIMRYIYNPIIGKNFGKEQLGYYAEAYKFFYLPSIIISTTIGGVSYPVLSKLNQETNRQIIYLRKMMRMTAFGIFPILLGAMACFDNLVITVLTKKWIHIIPYFQILAIAGMIMPFHSIISGFITLKGYPKRVFLLELYRNILIVVPLIVMVFFEMKDIRWMLWSFVAANLISYIIDIFYVRNIISYKIKEQLKDIVPYFGLAMCMAILVYAINFTPFSIYLKLILQIAIGVISYLLGCYLVKSDVLSEIFAMIKVGQHQPR